MQYQNIVVMSCVFDESICTAAGMIIHEVVLFLLYRSTSTEIVSDIYVYIDMIVNNASVRSNFDCDREGRRQICVERITSGIILKFPS